MWELWQQNIFCIQQVGIPFNPIYWFIFQYNGRENVIKCIVFSFPMEKVNDAKSQVDLS